MGKDEKLRDEKRRPVEEADGGGIPAEKLVYGGIGSVEWIQRGVGQEILLKAKNGRPDPKKP